MYGLVNKAIEDLALSLGGEPVWEQIRTKAGLESLTFVSLDGYDDEITYRLVAAASDVLGVPPHQVLESFGEHWVLYTGREGFGPMMAAYGTDTATFLVNLNALHSRVRLTMPQLKPPSFTVEETGAGKFLVHYHSTRSGLAPMVLGLLRGIGTMFNEQVTVSQVESIEDGASHDVFALTIAEAPAPATGP
jgi:Haem-NO-binding